MRSNKQHRHGPLCGPECRYRTLYEGTQSSLADMASKNAIALNRVGRLRQGIVLLLKSHIPRRFAELEAHLGMRLSEVDDESLLSCVQWLLEQERDEALLDGLRAALERAGYRIRPTDGLAEVLKAVQDGPVTPITAPRPEYTMYTSPVRPKLTLAEATAIAAEKAAERAAARTPTPTSAAQDPAPLADAAASPPPTPPEQSADGTNESLSSLFAEPEGTPDGSSGSPPPAASEDAEPRGDTQAASGGRAVAGVGEDSTAPPDDPKPAAEAASETPRPGRVVRGAPLRPELFPTAGRSATLPVRQRRKRSRVTAAAPLDAATAPAPPPPPPEDGLDDRLLAAVSVPRPVFVADLAEIAGSGEAVEAWIERCRSADESSLRFIPPKQRHRLRGSLVLPVGALRDAATEFEDAWWAECMAKFRGAKLYELAVLLHAVGDRVVSWRVSEDRSAVLLRLNEPRGVVGVIVVLGDQLGEGGAARAQLAANMEELLRDRLALLAVVVTAEPLLDPVTAALTQDAAAHGWAPSCHVVVAKSWEWATGNAAAARHVLG